MSDPRATHSNPKSRPGPGPGPGPGPRSNPQVSSPPGSARSTSGPSQGPSSVTAVQAPSLFDTLTKPTTEGYPATEVIKYLIEVVGRDVVSFRRNAQVSYLLVDRARDICDAINIHVKKTESGTDWSSFEKFSDAIDPVEDALFKLVAFTEDEKTLHLIEGNSVHDCIASADNWVTNREEIWTTLDHLETTTELTILFSGVNVSSRLAEREEARNHDDKTLLGDVIEDIDRAFSSLAKAPHDVVPTMIENLDELFNKVSAGDIPPDLTEFTLKTGLLVQGVTRLAYETPSLDPKTVSHLRSAPIWGAAAQLVELLTHDDVTESMDKVRVKYNEFLGLLNNTEDLDVPKSYINLLKLAGQVRRPFHSQAVALISLCRVLVTEFEKDTHRTSDNLVVLEEALNATLKALQEAIAAVAELKTFNLDNFEDHPAYKALTRAQKYVRKCHNTFALGDWSQVELLIADAIRKDKERMDWLNRLLQTRPPLASQVKVEQIELTVAVYDGSTSKSNHVHQTTFLVEGSTRLSAVRWTVAGALAEPLRKRARLGGEFRLVSEDTECELHDTVSQVAGSKKKYTLKLIV
ncbi:hypothetical protein EDB84DRAFT_1442629 [Lactarius hengduanensis]|nr:hypothetical protein EDB84DRAFT_1442629 [Lactarius hengduanensis]